MSWDHILDKDKVGIFSQYSTLYKAIYISLLSFNGRNRFVIGWICSEVICILAGVGYDESKADCMDIDVWKSTNFRKVELSPFIAQSVRNWNCTVQQWMATYVYRKLPIKSSSLRKVLTMGLSAFWHGVEIGYYFTFLVATPVQFVQQNMTPEILDLPLRDNAYVSTVYKGVLIFVNHSTMHFGVVPFLYPRIADFTYVWSVGNYWGIYMFLFTSCIALLGMLKRMLTKNLKK